MAAEKAKTTSTAMGAYVSGALGKLAYCNLAAAKTAQRTVEMESAETEVRQET